jgi:DNA-3-methyladenine glycosylase
VKRRLTRAFYARDAISVARDLIGCVLVHDAAEGRTSLRLVETEAYRGADDPGSHGYVGLRPRTEVMFGPAGHLYVYFTYGMHWCSNVVCGPTGICAAVLLRAGEPIEGIELMKQRRGVERERLVAAGPARLTQAMGIGRAHNGAKLVGRGELYLYEDDATADHRSREIARTVRVGLAPGRGDDLEWRFVLPGHPHASRSR